MDAVGYSGAEIDESLVQIAYDDVRVVLNGTAAPDVAEKDLAEILRRKAFTVTVDLHLGNGEASIYTCDCSEEYVKINSAYMT